ncbi:hypothetical protein HO133_009567 [Letharia lupina]|uniref:Small secreted protein n=1 Tax=Letharia lupina TaxID=560253 RepID=A0A8H6CLG1_9LECA|nr:uncharacterized protein HO133_009567 [Letharia lupina]KAF6225567.1 hypothetical protein HO133_009567 [Letharia lupina]
MCSFSSLVSLIVTACALLLLLTEAASPAKHLNITVTAAAFRNSVIQCWQLSTPLITSTQSGTRGSMVAQLGDLSNATYSIIPAETNGGAHTAPYPQFVAFVSGAAKITIPGSTQEAFVHAGKNGLLFAADTAALSRSRYGIIFTKETFLMHVPTAGGIVPPHTVLYTGPCRGDEFMR